MELAIWLHSHTVGSLMAVGDSAQMVLPIKSDILSNFPEWFSPQLRYIECKKNPQTWYEDSVNRFVTWKAANSFIDIPFLEFKPTVKLK